MPLASAVMFIRKGSGLLLYLQDLYRKRVLNADLGFALTEKLDQFLVEHSIVG